MQDTELPGVCLRWMRQANSQAAAIHVRMQEGLGNRKGAGGGGAITQKRSCSSAPFASPIVESSSTSTSTGAGADGSASGGDGTAACTVATTKQATKAWLWLQARAGRKTREGWWCVENPGSQSSCQSSSSLFKCRRREEKIQRYGSTKEKRKRAERPQQPTIALSHLPIATSRHYRSH
jgi:hypothetical protein